MERVLVSRQPIYRADMAELGYELLFRNSDTDNALLSDGDQATADVILNTCMDIGLDALVGQSTAFINFDRNLILGNYCECLPRDRVVLELLETVKPDAALLARLRTLRAAGYRLALDNFLVADSQTAYWNSRVLSKSIFSPTTGLRLNKRWQWSANILPNFR